MAQETDPTDDDPVIRDFQDALLTALNDIGEDYISMPRVMARMAEAGLEVRRVNRVT